MDGIAGSSKTTSLAQNATSDPSPNEQCNDGRRALSFDQLLAMPVPPQDHSHFDMPTKSEANNPEHDLSKEVDFHRNLGPAYDDQGFDAASRLHEESLKVTRETVQKFFQGELPEHDMPTDLKPLALFLLKNKLPNALAWLMVHTGSDELDLSSCSLGDAEMQTLATWIKSHPSLVQLNLGNNRLGPDGVKVLAETLSESQVTFLDLSHNQIGNEGVRALCQKMPHAPQLQGLMLKDVGMDNDGILALAEALPECALQKLSIWDSESKINDDGARQLASALRSNPVLKQIHLVFSGVEDEGWAQIAQSLKSNKQLQKLDLLARNRPESLRDHLFSSMLADALRSNRTLQNLRVGGIDLSMNGAAALVRSIESNASLVNVSLPRWTLAKDAPMRDRSIDS